MDRTGLPFHAYESFRPEEQAERQELYIRIAEWVWNPSRLDQDGEKPPTPEPIAEPDDDALDSADRPDRDEARFAFWRTLLSHANEVSDLHSRISARTASTGSGREGTDSGGTMSSCRTRPALSCISMRLRPRRTRPFSMSSTPNVRQSRSSSALHSSGSGLMTSVPRESALPSPVDGSTTRLGPQQLVRLWTPCSVCTGLSPGASRPLERRLPEHQASHSYARRQGQ